MQIAFARIGEIRMKRMAALLGTVTVLSAAMPAAATGLYTCESGPRENWKSSEELKKKLTGEGWDVRFIKEDGGCWEVYAIDAKGSRVEAYFHPVTLKNVYTSRR